MRANPPAPIGLDRVLKAMHGDAPTLWDVYRPGPPRLARLQMVLFMAQGHNLAHYGQPLFPDPIVRTETGIHIDLPTEFDTAEFPGNGQWNTIGAALSRYADVWMPDLRALVCTSDPWQKTLVGDPISVEAMQVWFTRPAETDDPDDERPGLARIAAWRRARWAPGASLPGSATT